MINDASREPPGSKAAQQDHGGGGRRMKPGRSATRAPKGPPQTPRGTPQGAPRGSLHRSVAQDIGARILNGEFAPGTLLPNEAEWCKSFGVSRTAVREA